MAYVYLTAGILVAVVLIAKFVRWIERGVAEEVGPAKFQEGVAHGKNLMYEAAREDQRLFERRLVAQYHAGYAAGRAEQLNAPAPSRTLPSTSAVIVPEGHSMTIRKDAVRTVESK